MCMHSHEELKWDQFSSVQFADFVKHWNWFVQNVFIFTNGTTTIINQVPTRCECAWLCNCWLFYLWLWLCLECVLLFAIETWTDSKIEIHICSFHKFYVIRLGVIYVKCHRSHSRGRCSNQKLKSKPNAHFTKQNMFFCW